MTFVMGCFTAVCALVCALLVLAVFFEIAFGFLKDASFDAIIGFLGTIGLFALFTLFFAVAVGAHL